MSRTVIDDEQLINLINSHTCLYNKGDKDYRDIYKKENVWQFIASSLSVSKEQVKARWTSLRQRFSREKAAIKLELRSGAIGGYKPRWPLYELLSFLENHITSRRTISNMNTSMDGTDGGNDFLDDEMNLYPEISQFDGLPEEILPSLNTNPSPKIISVISVPTLLSPLGSSNSSRESELHKSTTYRSPSLPSTSERAAVGQSIANLPTEKTTTDSRLPTGTSKRKRENESVDDSIAAVQKAITSWQEGLQKKKVRSPEVPFADFIATELSNFKNLRNADKVKAKICELIFEYKHIEEDV